MRRLLGAWILVCSISALGHAQAKQTDKKSHRKQDQTASNAASDLPVIQAPISPSPSIANKNAQQEQKRTDEHVRKRERFVRWLTDVRITDVVLDGLTLAYVITTAFLLIAVRKQSEIAISGERARLFERDAPQYQAADARRHAGCSVGFKNFGKSPAWIVSVAGSFQWIDDPKQLTRAPLYGAINWGDVIPLPQDEAQSFYVTNRIGGERSANARLAVFVSIEYRDRFNLSMRHKPRRLRYCFISTDGTLGLWSKGGPDHYNEYT